MPKLLLDEHISPDVAAGMRRRDRQVTVRSLVEWEGGNYLGKEDSACLREATVQELTLVTYDQKNDSKLAKEMG